MLAARQRHGSRAVEKRVPAALTIGATTADIADLAER